MTGRTPTTIPPPPAPGSTAAIEPNVTFELVVAAKAGTRVEILQPGQSYVVGRGQECDVVVPDVSVSRRHARITAGKEILLEDLGSSNGTRIGGRQLRPNETVTVAPESVIGVGTAVLIVQKRSRTGDSAHAASLSDLPDPSTDDFVVVDPTMRQLYATLDHIAPTGLSVLILGETGVGKDVFAHEIHRRSTRSDQLFLKLNCAALTESLLESELFGHEKGAFTGAAKAKAGLFESADGGTVFLDEVGEMSLALQSKLLRFLESGEVYRVGAVTARKVDVRVIAATNVNLPLAMREGRFRTDLYFRLNGVTFMIPALRNRKADIAPLAKKFVRIAAAKLGRPPPPVATSAIHMLEKMPWNGNVRELRNLIDRTMALRRETETRELTPGAITHSNLLSGEASLRAGEELPDFETTTHNVLGGITEVSPTLRTQPQSDLGAHLREIERERVLDALTRTGWNQSKAARMLGVTRAVLIHRVKVFGLSRPAELDPRAELDPKKGEE